KMLGTGYEVENFGRNGATLLTNGHNPYIKSDQYRAALNMKPDVAIIHLGLNDTDPRNYPIYQEQFLENYLSLIESFRVVNPKVRIILARLSPITHYHKRFSAGTKTWYDAIQLEIEHVAAVSRCELIDFEQVLFSRPDLLPDAIHPTCNGAALLARRVYSAITGDFGGLKMSVLYSDNMVLQRAETVKISGTANYGDKVEVIVDGEKNDDSGSAITDRNGGWSVDLHLNVYDQCRLKISTVAKSLEYNNVAVGEVWMVSGQSNMSLSVAQSASPQTAQPCQNIRLFKCTPTFDRKDSLPDSELDKLNELDFIGNNSWEVATKDQLSNFSAVGYYFAQKLKNTIGDVRIGLIQTSLGGAPAESFVSRRVMQRDPVLLTMLYDWRNNPASMQWCRDVANQNLKGAVIKNQRHYFEPTYLYESRIAPFSGFQIKGVLWYQGESNAENVELHEQHIFPAVVESFRECFANNLLPFYFVQLSSMNRPSWCRFRDSQRRTAQKIDNCEMVVSSDYGCENDVHPRQKDVIGERLAAVALNRDYGFSNIEYHSPCLKSIDDNVLKMNFADGLTTSDKKSVRGFETALEDMIFKKTDAVIRGDDIILDCDRFVYVRYAWSPYTDANVVNGVGLPLSTFQMKYSKTALKQLR
ncbi:MAG: sialate O-acetylesterase, partial [Rikenellaceae bacterium]